jgi:hypothetical protein
VPFRDTYFVIGNPLRLLDFRVLKRLVVLMLGILRRKPEPPGYPFADKLAPVKRGPKGRSGGAVAMEEPEDDLDTDANSRR